MTPLERKSLERLAKTLEESLIHIHELLKDSGKSIDRSPASRFDSVAELLVLRSLDRSGAEVRLSEMKQHELGAIFTEAGGPPADRKKPKSWLLEQILWRVFDFDRGHDAIRKHITGGS